MNIPPPPLIQRSSRYRKSEGNCHKSNRLHTNNDDKDICYKKKKNNNLHENNDDLKILIYMEW